MWQNVLYVTLPLVGIVLGWIIRRIYAGFQLSSEEQKAERIRQNAVQEAEAEKKEILLNAKDELIRERDRQEKENRAYRSEVQRYESRVSKKEEELDAQMKECARHEESVKKRESAAIESEKKLERALVNCELKLKEKIAEIQSELERVSEMSKEEAKALIIKSLEEEAKHDAQSLLNKIEEDAKLNAEKRAREILVTCIQRLASETTGDVTAIAVSLPSDEMKGRIIGREGRNIRALETLTGADIVIDDTPEAVVISCFDPIRKEIAKESLERLVTDGRIHPARIEEVVQKVTNDVEKKIYEEGERCLFDLGIHNMPTEGIRALGRLYFRTSYGQNVLYHSKEAAKLAAEIAAEVGADRELAMRAALLHDIGKGAESNSEQNHAEIGADMAKKWGEDERVVHAIAAHHNDIEPATLEAVIVQIADAISASRPGARRMSNDNYIKRLENLEAIAEKFEGVSKAYAIQAGRELRVLVNDSKVKDIEVKALASDIARQIEDNLNYPGRIRLTMIRETRVIEYAR